MGLLRDLEAACQKGEQGSRDYQLNEFGLTEQQVLDRFANYIETYNIAV